MASNSLPNRSKTESIDFVSAAVAQIQKILGDASNKEVREILTMVGSVHRLGITPIGVIQAPPPPIQAPKKGKKVEDEEAPLPRRRVAGAKSKDLVEAEDARLSALTALKSFPPSGDQETREGLISDLRFEEARIKSIRKGLLPPGRLAWLDPTPAEAAKAASSAGSKPSGANAPEAKQSQ